MRLAIPVVVIGCVVVGALAQSGYQIRAEDTIDITVVNQPDLSQQYVVDAAGNLEIKLIGTVQAVGLTEEALATGLRERLDEYFTNPQVTVTVQRTKRVFVFGGVASPGMYELTDNMTLIELLARAGYGGASEATIIRADDAVMPAQPSQAADTETITVNLREFERDLANGRLTRNVILEEGDTIFVPRFDPDRIFVSGEVQSPGAFSVPEGTTVIEALALAGGPTPEAALNRVSVLRIVDGKQETIDVELEDVVEPRDTIMVPERYF